MPLTPQDLEQIAALVKAGACGYLPPYLLGTQLQWRITPIGAVNPGDQIIGANANRVWLSFAVNGGFLVAPDPSFLPSVGWDADIVGAQKPLIFYTTRDGVLPQLAWFYITGAGSPGFVMEQVWSPPTGVGLV